VICSQIYWYQDLKLLLLLRDQQVKVKKGNQIIIKKAAVVETGDLFWSESNCCSCKFTHLLEYLSFDEVDDDSSQKGKTDTVRRSISFIFSPLL
jgi:hypothetical protein